MFNSVKYWISVKEDKEEILFGFIHSLLATFDGCNCGLPGFLIAPSCHPSDPDYHKENNKNWYPTNENNNLKCEIICGEMLHDSWNAYLRERGK